MATTYVRLRTGNREYSSSLNLTQVIDRINHGQPVPVNIGPHTNDGEVLATPWAIVYVYETEDE